METLNRLQPRVNELRKKSFELTGALRQLEESNQQQVDKIASLKSYADIAAKAKKLLETYALEQQEELQGAIEGLVTEGLQKVFEENLHFKVKYKIVQDVPNCVFSVLSFTGEEEVEHDIANSFGGGLAVVCGVLLRIVVLSYLVKLGSARPILILDEPLAALSPSYENNEESLRERMAQFLRTLSIDFGIQILLVTHEEDYGKYSDAYYIFEGGLGKPTRVTDATALPS